MVYLRPTTQEVYAIARDVCLSVCLCARLFKNARMDLDEMLRVDPIRVLVRMPEPDSFLP